jgi:hypothetical protein
MIRKADTVSLPGHCLSTRQLIVALPFIATPLLLILSACPCLSTRHLHLPPHVQLSFSPAGCQVASHCPAFATHPLDPQPFLSTRRVVVATPLVAPPLQLILSAHCCLLTRHFHLPLPFVSCLPWLVVASHLVAPPLPLILSTRCRLSTHQLVVAFPPHCAPLILWCCRHSSILAGCCVAS